MKCWYCHKPIIDDDFVDVGGDPAHWSCAEDRYDQRMMDLAAGEPIEDF